MRIIPAATVMAVLALTAGAPLTKVYAGGRSHPRVTFIGGGICNYDTTQIYPYDTGSETNSTTLQTIITSDFGQAKTGCVAGSFFANVGNQQSGDHVRLQILLDGSPCAPLEGNYYFANSGDDFSSHAVEFLCGTKIAAGNHELKVQFASQSGGLAQIYQNTLEILSN